MSANARGIAKPGLNEGGEGKHRQAITGHERVAFVSDSMVVN